VEAKYFDEQWLEALISLGIRRAYPKGTILVHEGDTSDQLFVLLDGRLKVFLSDAGGKEIVIDTLVPRQYFGELAFDGQPRSASVATLEASQVAIVQHDDFKHYLATHPDAAFVLIKTLIGRVRNLTHSIGSLALLDVYGRVARLLITNATEQSGQWVVTERMTQQQIAQRIGSSREMVSRILGDLKAGGYITMDRGSIVIRHNLPLHW